MSDESRFSGQKQGVVEKTCDYESPTIAIIGPLSKITLGSTGTHNDAMQTTKA